MILKRLPLMLVILGLLIGFAGCGEDEDDGDDGEITVGYKGDNATNCNDCHSAKVASWLLTDHPDAYVNLGVEDPANQENPYCLHCHTTGWDSEIAYGDTVITTYGPETTGYDDYFGVETAAAAERRAMLEGVQCEACHGPNADHESPDVVFGGDDLNCNQCHSGTTGQATEILQSGHGMVLETHGMTMEEFNAEFNAFSTCWTCHTTEGFVMNNDADHADMERPETANLIGCTACHDPHDVTNGYQLRTLADVSIEYDAEVSKTFTGHSTAQICVQCHHARRDVENVTTQIDSGDAHFGPHGSPQMDMYLGAGSYEIDGYTYSRDHLHQTVVVESCVECHMQRAVEIHGEIEEHSFHTFEPDVGNCLPCHTITDFDYGNVQTDIAAKMDELAVLLGFADAAAFLDADTGFDSEGEGVLRWKREAAYALVFVNNDGSHGVHNPTYAESLLDNAIAYAGANKK